MVTPQPSRKDARKEPSRAPTRTTGSANRTSQISGPRHKTGALTERVVDTEVETTVDDDTDDGGHESTVETGNTVGCEGLPVDIDETVELTSASALRGLRVVGQTGTSVVERVHEEKGRGTSRTTGGDVTAKPLPVAVGLLEAEEALEVILCRLRQSRRSTIWKRVHVLNAKLRACVGKYRMTLAVLPRQRETRPSSRYVREKQSTMPL